MHMQVFWLSWQGDNGSQWDGKWACPDAGHDYPSFSKSLMHPCAGTTGNCCRSLARALSLLRFESFFNAKNAYVSITYEVSPGSLGMALHMTLILAHSCMCTLLSQWLREVSCIA